MTANGSTVDLYEARSRGGIHLASASKYQPAGHMVGTRQRQANNR
jgi:hypothetical protein